MPPPRPLVPRWGYEFVCNMTPRLSGPVSTFGLVFFVLNSLLEIASQWSREILQFCPQSHVYIILIY